MRPVISLVLAVSLVACDGDRPANLREGPARVRPAQNAAITDTVLSVRDLFLATLPVGRRVRLTGRCVTTVPTFDRPAGAEQLWQLEGDGLTVVISGPPPRKCLTSRNATFVTITAIVAEDTLPPIADLPPAPRRYLLLIGGNAQ
jgi:hypothetical protein